MRICAIALTILLANELLADDLPDSDKLENDGAIIGNVILDKSNIFDLTIPAENNWLYRMANRYHVMTKDRVIRKQLLFQSGDPYSGRLVEESARILRQNRYLFDASIRTTHYENGVVDLAVSTRDIWTLTPDISISRKGGENRTKVGLEDSNLLGRGQLLRVARIETVDRDSNRLEFRDRHLGSSWVTAYLRIADNSDGKSNALSAVRPFYALDTRWSAGGSILDDDRRSALYFLGEEAAEYQHEREYLSAFGGWSKGLQAGWVRRWTAGFVFDDNRFSSVASPALPAVIPDDRKLAYAFVGLEMVEDEFEKAQNRDQMGQTEDFFLGSRFSASLGWSDRSLGADRDALVYSFAASHGFGSFDNNALLLKAYAGGRLESGRTTNALLTVDARYYRTQSARRLFVATLNATAGRNLDLDNPVQLGGDSGLRGYPLRYQSGNSKLLLTIEQRYFTDWYPFRLFRVGGAIFADTGRVWGSNPLGDEPFDWLTDVGIGLRIAPTRSSARKMLHLDFAFPLGGDASIDDFQIILESKRGF